jgi:phosphoglycolate phosphatase
MSKAPPGAARPTLVLDLDGTLVDTAEDLVATLNAVLARDGLAPVALSDVSGLVGMGARAMIAAAHDFHGRAVAPERLDPLMRDFLDHYADHLADRSRPFPGAEAMLDRFAAGGWRLAVCTNKTTAPARQLLAALGLADRFAAIAGQDTFAFRKPDPRHLTGTIRLAGGDPARAVMVGDSSIDVDTARAAGIPVVAVTFGYSPVPVETLGATRVIGHLDALFDAAAALV